MTNEQAPSGRSLISNLPRREEIREELRGWVRSGDISGDEYDIELHDKVFELVTLRLQDRPLGDTRLYPRSSTIFIEGIQQNA